MKKLSEAELKKRKALNSKILKWFVLPIVTLFVLAEILVGRPEATLDEPKIITLDQAQTYTILRAKSYPTPPEKQGFRIVIYSEGATTFEKRAQTAMQAALDAVENKGLYEVVIQMNASKDIEQFNVIAYVEYTPHKMNTWGQEQPYIWSVNASKHEIVNGKLVENGKSYPMSYVSMEKYLRE